MTVAGDHRPPRGRDPRPRPAPILIGPLSGRGVHPDPARPRLRRRRRGDQLGADRGRGRRSAVADQGDLPGAQEPGQPAQGGGVHTGAVALRVHQHFHGGGGRGAVRALPHPGVRPDLLGQRCWRTFTRHQDDWVDYENDDRAPLLFISGGEDHLMPPKVQRSNAKHYKSNTVTEVKGVRGLRAPAARPGGAGRRSPTTLSSGRSARRRGASDRLSRRPHHAHRRPDRPDRGRGLAAPDRPDLRPARAARTTSAGAPLAQAGRPRRCRRRRSLPVDAVLLTHDHHGDNLDDAGRGAPASVGVVVTTAPGPRAARRHGARA